MNEIVSQNEMKGSKLKQLPVWINSNAVATPSHALFTASFSLNLLWYLTYKTGKFLTVSGSSSSLEISRKTFSIFSTFKIRVSCSASTIYLFTFFTWRVLIFSLRNILWAIYEVKVSKISYLSFYLATCL